MTEVRYDQATGLLNVRAERIGSRTARFVVMATGCLTVPNAGYKGFVLA